MSELLETWARDAAHEDCMTDEHRWIWQAMIAEALPDYSGLNVLDIGCNQGGFLRLLADSTGMASGVGIDLARQAVAQAEASKGDRPLRYLASTELGDAGANFDVAFSHEVIYLIADLEAHAHQVAGILKPGASYFAVTVCHADNPLWPRWHPMIQDYSNIDVPSHSVAHICEAFRRVGFDVSVSRFLARTQIPMEGPSELFPSDTDRLELYTNWKLMFRFTKL